MFGTTGGLPRLGSGCRWIAHLGTEYIGNYEDSKRHMKPTRASWITPILIKGTNLQCGVVLVPEEPYVRVIIALTRSSSEALKGGRQGMFDRGGVAAKMYAELDPILPSLIICRYGTAQQEFPT